MRKMGRLPVDGSFPAHCACGKTFSLEEWEKLPYDGVQMCFGYIPDFEMRRCPCGSSPSVHLKPVAA
jgi:hypothetical protein